MKFVCPLPLPWSETYLELQKAWEASGRLGDNPPVPLILNGWCFSNDYEKHRRWLDTIEWANRYRLAHLIPELSDAEKYFVDEFNSHAGPVFGDQFEKPKTKPTLEEENQILRQLQKNWSEIIGTELADHTYPLRFSGKKRRQLVVGVNVHHNPPWGGWNSFHSEGDRSAFTTFRKQINDAVAPHGIDHVVFEEKRLKNG